MIALKRINTHDLAWAQCESTDELKPDVLDGVLIYAGEVSRVRYPATGRCLELHAFELAPYLTLAVGIKKIV